MMIVKSVVEKSIVWGLGAERRKKKSREKRRVWVVSRDWEEEKKGRRKVYWDEIP